MRDEVKFRLDKIATLYPSKRLMHSKRRWEELYKGLPFLDRAPYVYDYAMYNAYNYTGMKEERLIAELDQIIVHGLADDDYIPGLFCGCRSSTIPNMFGVKEIVKNGDVSCERIELTEKLIDNKFEGKIYDGSVAKMFLEMQEYFLEETCGLLPIHVIDMQGPFDVGGALFGYDDYLTLGYTDIDRFFNVTNKLRDAFMLLWNAQKNLLKDNFVGTHLLAWSYVPKDYGITMSIDSLVMISPTFYDKCYKPIIDSMSKNAGQISVHSCGNFAHLLPNLSNTMSITAVNSSQMSVKTLYERGLKRVLPIACLLPSEYKEMTDFMVEKQLRIDCNLLCFWQEFVLNPDKIKKVDEEMQYKLSMIK